MRQLTFDDFLTPSTPYDTNDYLTWCDYCEYDERGCCNYNKPLGRTCVEGSGFVRRGEHIKSYVITYATKTGALAHQRLKATQENLVKEVGKWRLNNPDYYFKFVEEV